MSNRTYFAASVGHRFGDTHQTFVAIERSNVDIVGSTGIAAKLEEIAVRAAEYEREEIVANCNDEREFNDRHEDGEECDCGDTVVTYGAFSNDVRDLFNARELAEHRRALMNGEVVVLYS